MRLSERRAELVRTMPSVSILGEAKRAIKRAQSRTCSSYAEREHFRRNQWSMFNVQSSKMRLNESRIELVQIMPSVSILGEAKNAIKRAQS